MVNESWLHDAACRDEEPDLFFPVGDRGPALLQVAAAKAVCRRCTVQEQCLAWVMEDGPASGVWAGLDEDERRALGRREGRRALTGRSAG